MDQNERTDYSTDRKLIAHRLQKIEGQLDRISVDIVGLKVRAGLWGALAGSIPLLLAFALKALAK